MILVHIQSVVFDAKNVLSIEIRFVEISAGIGTWFEGVKLPIQVVILLIYQFCQGDTYHRCIHECNIIDDEKRLSQSSIADMFSFCREVCVIALDDVFSYELIGGPGCIVEINESKIGKRKYNRGRMVEGTWIFGMIDVTNVGSFRLEICTDNKRDAATLIPLIKKHVAPGTTIRSDCWKAYDRLNEHGYLHEKVNHSENFVDPESGAHTQTIESSWRPIKRRLTRGGVKRDELAMHLCEYLFKKTMNASGRSIFEEFVKHITKIFFFFLNKKKKY